MNGIPSKPKVAAGRISGCAAILLVMLLQVIPGTGRTFAYQDEPEPRGKAEQETADSTVSALQGRISQLRTLLPESVKVEEERRQITQLLDRAEEDLKLAIKQQEKVKDLQAQTEGLSEEVNRLNMPVEVKIPDNLKQLPQPELETMLASEQVSLTSAVSKQTEFESAAVDPAASKRDLAQQEVTIAQLLTDLEDQLSKLPTDATAPADRASRFALMARGIRLQQDAQVVQASLGKRDAEIVLNLPGLRVSAQKKLVSSQKALVDALKQEVERRRQAESSEQLADAKTAERNPDSLSSPKLRALVGRRSELAAVNEDLAVRRLPEAERRLKVKTDQISRLDLQRQKIQNRIEKFGATGTIGQDLLYFHNRFPRKTDLERELLEIGSDLSELRPKVMDYSDELDEFERIAATVEGQSNPNADDIEFINGYRKLLRTLKDNTVRLASMLSDLDGENRRILAVMTEWADYVSEHSLWFRSHEALSLADLKALPANGQRAVKDFGKAVSTVAREQGIVFVGLVVASIFVFVVLVTLQNKAKLAIRDHAATARRFDCQTMKPTLRTLLLTAAVAGEWPLLCVLLGYLLHIAGGDAWKAGTAMIHLGCVTLWMNCLRHSVRKEGLADAHFRWNPSLCSKLGRWMHFLIAVTVIPLFCLLFVRLYSYKDDSLDRILFVVLMLVLSAVMIRLFLPLSNPFVRAISRVSPLVEKTRWIWAGIPLVVPLILAVLSAAGYHYTAVELSRRVASTIVALSVVLLVHQLLVRWLQISETRTRLQLEQQRAEEQARVKAEGEAAEDQAAIPPIPDDHVDLELFGLQADGLVRNASLLVALACTWMIWASVLPALRLLDREPLWYVTEERPVERPVVSDPVSGDTVESESVAGTETRVQQIMETVRRPVTVGSLLFAVFAMAITVMGVRQLPGLLELVLQSSSSFDAGMRYTICTVVRYLVLIVGAMVVFAAVGLRWGQVQWLVAGLSVGLGFGLQEVFANFISGLIILVERPVRIGDIVTIDGVSGIVSRIRIRATSITDWDRREYIVPNREFVTGKLLNWTLSDTTNRVMIYVGVSYGADPDRAREIMMQVAKDHPNVMDDPAPITTFETFGDSSLGLVLRAYLPNLDERLATITQLHTEINKRFIAAGIEIPFPQRDVHIRSSVVPQLPGN